MPSATSLRHPSTTVDFRAGYAADPDTIRQNVRRLRALGVVGLNFEDQGMNVLRLFGIEDQVARQLVVLGTSVARINKRDTTITELANVPRR